MRPQFSTLPLLLLLLSLVLLVVATAALEHDSESSVPQRAWMQSYRDILSGSTPSASTMHSVLNLMADQLRAAYPDLADSKNNDSSYKYFGFIPMVSGIVLPNTTYSWSASCFDSNTLTVSMEKNEDGSTDYVLTFVVDKRVGGFACEDLYLVAAIDGAQFKAFIMEGTHTLRWRLPTANANKTQSQVDAELWDLQNKGFRLLRFRSDRTQLLADIVATADLFIPALVPGPGVPEKTQDANLKFLSEYAQIKMEPRNNTIYALDESEIHSGDFLGVIRLDGLDPMLAWGMGAHTGHTTVALWIDGELYICESTTNSNYWPTNGIQKTPYQTWLKQAYAADYNVVHLPLSSSARAQFNETAAIEWFLGVAEGLPYGFNDMLFTWLDTTWDNLPCLPPDFEWCLEPTSVEALAGMVEGIDANLADLMFNLALKRRINPSNPDNSLRFSEVMYFSETQMKMNFSELVLQPEQDVWVYPTGYQMVCDVLVCETWKNGGLFGALTDSIQCTEFTNFDAYSLNIFNASYVRPQACVDADPDSQFCQLMGSYRMALPGYNSKAMYSHMAEKCPSRGPAYYRPSDC